MILRTLISRQCGARRGEEKKENEEKEEKRRIRRKKKKKEEKRRKKKKRRRKEEEKKKKRRRKEMREVAADARFVSRPREVARRNHEHDGHVGAGVEGDDEREAEGTAAVHQSGFVSPSLF